MIAFKYRGGQVVKIRPAAVALVTLASQTATVMTVLDEVLASTFRALQSVRPANLTNQSVAFLLVDQVINVIIGNSRPVGVYRFHQLRLFSIHARPPKRATAKRRQINAQSVLVMDNMFFKPLVADSKGLQNSKNLNSVISSSGITRYTNSKKSAGFLK